MSTRALVGMYNYDGSIDAIYVHNSGNRLLPLLERYYNTEDIVRELIDLGDASYLDKELYPSGEHSFRNPESGVSVFYGRDRGESGVDYETYSNLDMILDRLNDGIDYIYVFEPDYGNWEVYDRDFVDLYYEKYVRRSKARRYTESRKRRFRR